MRNQCSVPSLAFDELLERRLCGAILPTCGMVIDTITFGVYALRKPMSGGLRGWMAIDLDGGRYAEISDGLISSSIYVGNVRLGDPFYG
jgi:hypothetical protein